MTYHFLYVFTLCVLFKNASFYQKDVISHSFSKSAKPSTNLKLFFFIRCEEEIQVCFFPKGVAGYSCVFIQ